MKTIKVYITESDIIRAIRNPIRSPIELGVAKALKREIESVDVKNDGIYCWIYDDGDYIKYRYCKEDIDKVHNFMECWQDFIDNKVKEFNESEFVFCIEEIL